VLVGFLGVECLLGTVAGGVVDGLAVADAKLEKDVAEVEFDRAFADVEDGGDFLVGEAALNEVEDALLLASQRDALHGAGAGELGGEARKFFQDDGGDPEAAVGDGVDGGEKLLFDFAVGEKALDAQQEQAAELFARLWGVEDEGGGAREAQAEGAEILAESGGESSGVEEEDRPGLHRGRPVGVRVPVGRDRSRWGVEDLLGRKEAEGGVGGEQTAEVGGGQGVVLHQADSDSGLGALA
jgi:hypothetical protein